MIKVIPQFVPSEPFTVLVSGGVDSIAAAHWLKHQYHKKFSILHFNHRVQPINDEMRNRVRKFCIDFEIPYDSYFRTDEECSDLSENGLRQFRLKVMETIGGKFVTGHHLNDAVENSMMMMFKGTPEYKPIKEFTQFTEFSIYHPFLKTSKQDFIDYIDQNDLGKYVVEDPTNNDNTQLRNWIRNIILPEINTRINMETVVFKKFYSNKKTTKKI